jgi:hypothetical protein
MEPPAAGYLDRRHLPADASPLRLLGVDYVHLPTADGGDLYVTWHGLHLLEHLQPENWKEPDWFRAHSIRLLGTGTVYRLRTKPVQGRDAEFVVKYSRVGEDVPVDAATFSRFADLEFNTPYEEFSRLMDLRNRRQGPRILTHRPLGIYVPAAPLALWESGRSEARIARKKARYRDVELDLFRQYVLIYEWIKGVSADEAFLDLPGAFRQKTISDLTERARLDLEQQGYRVVDHKATHVIVRPRQDGSLLRNPRHEYAYALVDFELLERTPGYQHDVEISRRAIYLKKQRERFGIPLRPETFPAHLQPANVLGVDYVFGHAESTHGRLWVAGRDPGLFDYFLPERWRHTPGKPLSQEGETHYTRTKDNIHVVWKVSRVGEMPRTPECAAHGFNSPFEEFAIALHLASKGVPVTPPRAIYMSGHESSRADLYVKDRRRFEALRELVQENGKPLFRPDHNYLTLWGYWNGDVEPGEDQEKTHLSPIDAAQARKQGRITPEQLHALMERSAAQLQAAGYRNLRPSPSHLLLSMRHDKSLVLDNDGLPTAGLCNFSLLRLLADG